MSQLDLDLRGDLGSPPGRPPRPEGPVAAPDDDPTAPSPLPESALTPTIRGQERLEQALRARLGPKVMVQLTQNRTTMVSFRRRRGVLYARLHALFAHATEPVLDAIAEFLSHPEPTEAATRRLDAFLDRHRDLVDQNRVERLVPQPEGRHHDLQRLFDTLNAEYFGGRITARITWTKAARGKRLTMRLGSYSEEENLIRIHPALDRAFVPEYFVASVVFHEMLHELHGAEELGDGRRQVHSPAFLEDERRFADYIRAKRWEQKHIRRLLRY
ncbi:MAG: hypothetical protein KC933_04815 [Myxococcales bacterium]|nr:hypothetical protein [Myxococcales bacterium]MCB9650754.1 hypothetical protein [Deltaproteobacteria bacterium]